MILHISRAKIRCVWIYRKLDVLTWRHVLNLLLRHKKNSSTETLHMMTSGNFYKPETTWIIVITQASDWWPAYVYSVRPAPPPRPFSFFVWGVFCHLLNIASTYLPRDKRRVTKPWIAHPSRKVNFKGTSHGFWVPGKKGDLFSAS